MKRGGLGVGLAALLCFGFGAPVDLPPARTFIENDAEVARALSDELARSMKELKLGDSPRPYYVAYALSDVEQATAVATFGASSSVYGYRGRTIRTDVRVGSPTFDNTNTPESVFGANVEALPVDDDYTSLRRELWLRTDEAYKSAIETLAKKKATAAGQANHDEESDAPDFSRDNPAKFTVPFSGTYPESDALRGLVESLSGVLRESPQLLVGRATAIQSWVRRRFVSSEEAQSDEQKTTLRIDVVAEAQSPDGMRLVNFVSFTALSPKDLPALPEMQRGVRRMAAELIGMIKAPIASSGTASVLFEGTAAAQIAKLLVADNASGTPAPRTAAGSDERGQSSEFSDRLGQKVASPLLTVFDDPLREVVATPQSGGATTGVHGAALWGAFRIDDEGIPAARVSLIEGGVLKGLLMTRTPRKELPHSNGHARATRFGAPHAMIGNLFVIPKVGDPRGALSRPALLGEMMRLGRTGSTASYILRLLDDPSIPGVGNADDGVSMMSLGGNGRSAPSVRPLVVYRLNANGKEELVRGLTLEGLVPRSLRDITAMSRDLAVYNFQEGGAGFAGIPSTIVTPSLLFSDVDVRRSVGKNRRPPLYAKPEF